MEGITLEDGLDRLRAVQVESQSKEETLSGIQKSKDPMRPHLLQKKWYLLNLKLKSLDQINAQIDHLQSLKR